jgi:hypothetical protein
MDRSTWDSAAKCMTPYGTVLTEDPVQRPAIADVHLLEGVALGVGHLGHRVRVAGVGEPVQVHDPVVGVAESGGGPLRNR